MRAAKKKKYGLYDFLKRELTEYELYQAPPREVHEILLARFGFKKRQVNKHSLGSWLRRTRKKLKAGSPVPLPKTARAVPGKISEGFMGFQPTDPMAASSSVGKKDTLLKRPSYTK